MEKKISKKTIDKVNDLWNFIIYLPQETKEGFDKLCEEKEIQL